LSYTHTYDTYHLLGKVSPTIMAHCVHLTDEEIELLRTNEVYVAHCPQSNTNLSSGIAPIRHLLQRGVRVGLGSDIAGGCSLSLFRAMCEAIQVSKLYQVLIDSQMAPLTLNEVFYMGTKGGGSFFGKVGSFETGYALDAIILDDSYLRHEEKLTLSQRLERILYLSDDHTLVGKYVDGYPII
ncbi:MAG: amidohydrolase family protein, partial [Cellulosilyticaceae bacterium]